MARRQKNNRWRAPRQSGGHTGRPTLLRRLSSPLIVACWVCVAVVLVYVYWLRAPRPEVGILGVHTKTPDHQAMGVASWELAIDQPGFASPGNAELSGDGGAQPPSVAGRLQDVVGELKDSSVGIFYYEVPGIVVAGRTGETQPVLLPDDWLEEPVEQEDFIALSTKCHEVQKWLSEGGPANGQGENQRYAIVVFDCQVSSQLWARGLYGQDFVKAAKSYLRLWLQESEMQRTIVLMSCDENEVSWVEPSWGTSVFGNFFLEGVRGAADGSMQQAKDERVSVAELCEYLATEVGQWVQRHRSARQGVVVMHSPRSSPDVWEDVYLNAYRPAVLNSVTSRQVSLPNDAQQVLQQQEEHLVALETLWTRCYTQWDVSLHREQLDSHHWVQIFQHLLDAEYAIRHGVTRGIDASLRAADHQLTALQRRGTDRWDALSYSLALEQLVTQNQHGLNDVPAVDLPDGDEAKDEVPGGSSSAVLGAGDAEVPAPVPPETGGCGDDLQQNTTATEASAETPQLPKGSGGNVATGSVGPGATETEKDAASPGEKPESVPGESPSPVPESVGAGVASAEQSSQVPPAAGTLPGEGVTRDPAQLVADFMQNQLSAQQVFDRVEGLEVLLPAELEFLVMSVAGRVPEMDESALRADDDAIRKVLLNRLLLEKTWCIAGGLAPYVTKWMESPTLAADQLQRRDEDLLWNVNDIAIETGDAPAEPLMPLRGLSSVMGQAGMALQQWKRSLALAPFLMRLNLEQPSTDTDEVSSLFLQRIRQQTLTQFGSVGELTRQFRRPVENHRQWVSQVDSLGNRLSESNRQLQIEMASECERILAAEVDAPGQWRSIDRLLRYPLLAGGAPADRALKRRKLVSRILEVGKQSELADGNPPQRVPAAKSPVLMQWRANEAELLRLYAGLDGSRSTDQQSVASRVQNDDLWTNLARTVMQQDVAARILLRFVAGNASEAFTVEDVDRQCRQSWSSFYCRLALRRLDDFWGRQVNGRLYYQRISNRCLKQAAAFQDGSESPLYRVVEERQRALNKIVLTARYQDADRAGLVEYVQHVPGVLGKIQGSEWFGTDTRSMTARLQLEPGFPDGVLALRGPGVDGIERVSADPVGDGRSQVRITLRRKRVDVAFDESLEFELRYRGHRWPAPAMVKVVSEEEWGVLRMRPGAPGPASLSVEPAQRELARTSVLFVLDCSRSMAQGRRMETLIETLDQFAQLVQGSQIQVGVRLFGHRYEWRTDDADSELQARQDSELKMDLKDFDSAALMEFKELVRNLAPRGETPLFYALSRTVEDFRQAGAGRKLVILVTDGVDNWAQSKEAATQLQEISTALPAVGIRVNAIGFDGDQDGFVQLRKIAGVTGGTAVDASNSGLLSRLLAALEPFYFRVQERGTAEEVVSSRLLPMGLSEPLEIPAGIFDVFVMDKDRKNVASRKGVRVQAGQTHRLYYQTGQLSYGLPAFRQDLAYSSREQQPVLRIVQAERRGAAGLRITVSLVDERDASWVPEVVWVDLQSLDGQPRRYVLPGTLANDAVGRFPAWTFDLAGWDHSASRIKVQVRWMSRAQLRELKQVSPWKLGDQQSPVIDGLTVTRNEFPVEYDGQGGWSRLTLVAAEDSPLMPWNLQLLSPEWSAAVALGIHPEKRLATFHYRFQEPGTAASLAVLPAADRSQQREVTMRLSLGSVVVPAQDAP